MVEAALDLKTGVVAIGKSGEPAVTTSPGFVIGPVVDNEPGVCAMPHAVETLLANKCEGPFLVTAGGFRTVRGEQFYISTCGTCAGTLDLNSNIVLSIAPPGVPLGLPAWTQIPFAAPGGWRQTRNQILDAMEQEELKMRRSLRRRIMLGLLKGTKNFRNESKYSNLRKALRKIYVEPDESIVSYWLLIGEGVSCHIVTSDGRVLMIEYGPVGDESAVSDVEELSDSDPDGPDEAALLARKIQKHRKACLFDRLISRWG